MKKLTYCLLTTILFFSVLSFGACKKQDTPVYEEITLTKDNYSDYIAINVYYTDCTALPSSETNDYVTYYHLYCICNIETAKKKDCYFVDVEIKYLISSALWSTHLSTSPVAQLGYDGYSHSSCSMEHTTDLGKIYFPDSSPNLVKVSSISGKVYVLKENEQ